MKKQKGYTSVELVVSIFGLAIAVGWVMNVVEVYQTASDPITGMFILRCVGILAAPLGGVLGYL